jgi:hypothetical protein
MPPVEVAVEPAPVEVPEEAVEKRLAVPPNPKRYVFGVAYPADTVDGHGEWMSAEAVEKAAWEFNRNHRQLGFFHADSTLGHAEVVESYIYRGPDWTTTDLYGETQVIKAGDWLLGAQFDESGFEAVVSERADGWSIDGAARRRIAPIPGR